jgi:hypothetical protein
MNSYPRPFASKPGRIDNWIENLLASAALLSAVVP